MGWQRMSALGMCGLGLLLAAGCDSTDLLSSGLKNKPPKKKDAGVAMDAGSDAGTGDAGADGGPPPDATGDDGCASCGNQPPTVSAGADVITDEGSTVTLAATANDPDADTLSYAWRFWTDPQPQGAAVHCALGNPSAATTTFTCDNDVIAFAQVTVSDTHGTAASDEVRVQFRNVIATAQWLSPADGTVLRKDQLTAPMIEIHDPAPVDALACLLYRDDDMDSNIAFFPPTRESDGRLTCNFPPTTYLTAITGMRTLLWQVAMQDQQDPTGETRIVVWDADPAEYVSGKGTMPACTSQATLAFAARYPTIQATTPEGYFRLDDVAGNMHFRSSELSWFVVSRIRASVPPDRVAIAGHGHNGDQACDFLLFARGPLPSQYEQGARFGEARAQIRCGAQVYDTVMTDPFGALDVDRSTLNAFITGDVHIQYPHLPVTLLNGCEDPAKEGLDCTNDYTVHVQSGTCQAGQCVIACKAPDATSAWGDCDGVGRNGCETDLSSDSANCGACGRFCAGDCVQGSCQPAGP
jgi:hypothetical protein